MVVSLISCRRQNDLSFISDTEGHSGSSVVPLNATKLLSLKELILEAYILHCFTGLRNRQPAG